MEQQPNPVTVFVCGVLSLLSCGFVTGIPAIILGNKALLWEYSDYYVESDLALIKASRILGIISTVWCCAGLMLWMFVLQHDPRPQRDPYPQRYSL